MAIQQVLGSIHVQLVGLLKCSGQSDNTATQGIYNKSMYNIQPEMIQPELLKNNNFARKTISVFPHMGKHFFT